MSKNFLTYMDSPIGVLGIIESDGHIIHIFFEGREKINVETVEEETDLLKETKNQLGQYFKGERRDFDLPLKTTGTAFQRAAWQALIDIPYGQTRSYKEQAEKVGSPKAYRAVGLANNRNPIAVVIPCHRVIGANGKLVGYGGGLDIKETLLNLERKVIGK